MIPAFHVFARLHRIVAVAFAVMAPAAAAGALSGVVA